MSTGKGSAVRSLDLDALRGFAIVLVVVGHVLQYQDPAAYATNPLFRAIYAFHMPLFFFISGQAAGRGRQDDSLRAVANKSRALLIPWAVWSFGFAVADYVVRDPAGPLGGLLDIYWFLPVLFICFLFLFLAQSLKLQLNGRCPQWLLLLMIWSTTLVFSGFWTSSVRYHFIFFLIGLILGQKMWEPKTQGYWSLVILSFVGIILPYGIVFSSFFQSEGAADPTLPFLPRCLVALALTFSAWMIIARLPARLKSLLADIGLYSIHIYLIHLIVIQYVEIGQSVFSQIGAVLLLIILAIGIAKSAKRFALSKVIFGR